MLRGHAHLDPLCPRPSVGPPEFRPLRYAADVPSRIPNLPFFYLLYRAWSHWRAIAGGKHIQWLLEKKLVKPAPSKILDDLYATHAATPKEPQNKEQTLLTQKEVQTFSSQLDIPALEIELERAIWQVEQSLKDPNQEETPKDASAGTVSEKSEASPPPENKSDNKKDQ